MKPGETLRALRTEGPLVHCITNYVAMDISANVLLAIGASPAMIHAEEEAGAFAGIAGALLLNIGTLSPPWVQGMHRAVDGAARRPIVLDPVGAGATAYRTRVARALGPSTSVVRGNASEIRALVEGGSGGKGVDATDSVDDAARAARRLAETWGCVVAMTGATDLITDGAREVRVRGGDVLMTKVTAVGCALSATVAACAAVSDPMSGAVAACALFAVAGEAAARQARGPGSFRTALLDRLHDTSAADLDAAIDAA